MYAHFKTPISLVIDHARYLLDEVAKRRAGRSAVALSHFSRNGVKSRVALKWKREGGPTAYDAISRVTKAFAEDQLPSRLPYKLRDAAELLQLAGPDADRQQFLDGLLRQALDGMEIDVALTDAITTLIEAGLMLHGNEPRRAVDGLLLCRYLATRGAEDSE